MKQQLRSSFKNIPAYTRYLRIKYHYFKKIEKRILFFTLSLTLLFFTIQAQTSNSRWKENFDVHKFKTVSIDIKGQSNLLQIKNMQGITVIDARADTANVGFMQKKIVDPIAGTLDNSLKNQTEQRTNTRPTFIRLGDGLQNEAASYLAHSIVFPGNNTLPGILMVIKKLWLSDELNLNDEQLQNGITSPDSKDLWTSGIDVKIEFYLKDKSDYYPLYRYDSIISEAMTVSEYAPQFIELAMQLSLEKMKKMDDKVEAITSRRKFSLKEINEHNANEFNMPALKDTALNTGVYLTFDEFKNNNPSQTNYEIKKDKLIDVIYIKQPNGTEYTTREIWGYSDGKNVYIKSANNFFLLQRNTNAFYVYGAKRSITERLYYNSFNSGNAIYAEGNGSTSASSTASPNAYMPPKRTVQLLPFQLDWSTGKLY